MARVKITSHGGPHSTRVEIDGQFVPSIRAFHLGQDMHGCPVLELSILCRELEIEVDDAVIEAAPITPDRRAMM